MMQTAPVLRLNPAQVAQLIGYCTAYRAYLWQSVMPTPERNQAIRSLQAFQGRLEKVQEQGGQSESAFPVTVEEKNAVRQLLSGLIQLYGNAPPSEQRTRQLAEIAGFRMMIERVGRQTQAF